MYRNEIWKQIDGYAGYEVSNLGRVRSLDREIFGGNKRRGKLLKPAKSKQGYLYVSLYRNRESKKMRVHRLVAFMFIPNTENKYEVNHINGNKLNNKVNNLEWVTREENNKHAYVTNLNSCIGEGHHQAKLTVKQVVDIHERLMRGERGVTLAREYGVKKRTISDIKLGISWRSVTQNLKERTS
ncbi:NUMOD4 domain-containing protein [Virgibacillus salexigens]|uniref:NUMOD4 domain-containing protein n=1 Tax=Virgibacillus salexigens TaxID=61016 RepID=UPI00190E03BA|nr:NUMOD4 domain-containing protein [Virgibacillus salexigens]